MTYLYLMRIDGTNFYKIGFSWNPTARMRSISNSLEASGWPHALTLVAAFPYEDGEIRDAEWEWHDIFSDRRADVPTHNNGSTEWLNLTQQMVHAFRTFNVLRRMDRRLGIARGE